MEKAIADEMTTKSRGIPQEVTAMVARTISRSEARTNPKCQAALDKEWKKLEDAKVWLSSGVEECSKVKRQAEKEGKYTSEVSTS